MNIHFLLIKFDFQNQHVRNKIIANIDISSVTMIAFRSCIFRLVWALHSIQYLSIIPGHRRTAIRTYHKALIVRPLIHHNNSLIRARCHSDVLATGIEWEEYAAGAEYAAEHGELLQPGALDAIEEYGWALKGPTATPIGKGFRSINVQLRQRFNTYANLRPVRTLPGVPTRFENVDLVIVRENTEDLYKGIEYMLNDEIANGVKLITKPACERICRFAFDYAAANGRKKVTAVHKANIMKLTDGMFLSTFREVAKDYPAIEADDCIIDALCMKLVQKPEQFDVLVAPNLYGDIISDLCAGLVGGLGFAPSANIGAKTRIYEAVHGSAPDIAGQNKANPSAILMAFAMMLNDLGMTDKAARLNAAILAQVAEGKAVTADIGGTATTTEFTDAVAARL